MKSHPVHRATVLALEATDRLAKFPSRRGPSAPHKSNHSTCNDLLGQSQRTCLSDERRGESLATSPRRKMSIPVIMDPGDKAIELEAGPSLLLESWCHNCRLYCRARRGFSYEGLDPRRMEESDVP